MWIKLFGAVALIVAGWWLGKLLSEKLRIRFESLQAFDSALVMLEGEMSYAQNGIDTAFRNIEKAVGLGGFFERVADGVAKVGVRNAWRKELCEHREELSLTGEDVRILSALSAELGVSNVENQIKSIRYVRNMLSGAKSDAEERYKTLSVLYKKLCFGGALMILIVII